MGLIPLASAVEASNTAPGVGKDSPGNDERDGAIAGGDAPSEAEISSSEAIISAAEVILMMEKICPRGSDWGV